MHELSLVFFTVLAQTAVGMFIALGLVEMLGKPDEKAMNKAFIATWVVMGLGALASITHMGTPMRMMNVVLGLKLIWQDISGHFFTLLPQAFVHT